MCIRVDQKKKEKNNSPHFCISYRNRHNYLSARRPRLAEASKNCLAKPPTSTLKLKMALSHTKNNNKKQLYRL